ncbi:hypothetical protein BJF78_21380 [Pseudonocardia sp. CNS-139]|nr:hypothetical protein BJF78_21380 [Pseudonocardia sp. CNS-139]
MPAVQTPQRLQLGRELRAWRERRDLEAREVATRLLCSPSKISRIESGKAALLPLELEMLLQIYEVPADEAERIKAIGAASRQQRSKFRVVPWLRDYIGLEAEAVEIKSFQIDLVPGLLQTESYARAVAAAIDPTRPSAEVERLVKIRQQRQARLTSDEPPTLTAVIHEAALRMWMGGPDVMREQLKRLLELAKLPNVTVRVLPFRVGGHGALGSAFTVLRLPDPADSQVVYLEDLWSADYVNRPEQVAAYSEAFDRLVEASLDTKGTAAMITEATGELR